MTCPHIVESKGGTMYCALDEASIRQRDGRIAEMEAELEELRLYRSETQRLLDVLNNEVLNPDGDGPKKPSMCDLVSFVATDRRAYVDQLADWKRVAGELAKALKEIAEARGYKDLADSKALAAFEAMEKQGK